MYNLELRGGIHVCMNKVIQPSEDQKNSNNQKVSMMHTALLGMKKEKENSQKCIIFSL